MTLTTNSVSVPEVVARKGFEVAPTASAFLELSGELEDLTGRSSVGHTFVAGEGAYVSEGGKKPLANSTIISTAFTPKKFVYNSLSTTEFTEDYAKLQADALAAAPSALLISLDRAILDGLKEGGTPVSEGTAAGFGSFKDLPTLQVRDDSALEDVIAGLNGGTSSNIQIAISRKYLSKIKGAKNALGTPIFNVSDKHINGYEYALLPVNDDVAIVGNFRDYARGGIAYDSISVKTNTAGTVGDVNLNEDNVIQNIVEARIAYNFADGLNAFARIGWVGDDPAPELPGKKVWSLSVDASEGTYVVAGDDWASDPIDFDATPQEVQDALGHGASVIGVVGAYALVFPENVELTLDADELTGTATLV